jgi:hypothetical protein
VPYPITVDVGRVPIRLTSSSEPYARVLAGRFQGFVASDDVAPFLDLDIDLAEPGEGDPDEELTVSRDGERWTIRRSDCHAVVDLHEGRGRIVQPAYPYATDTLLRVVHSVLLARQGGLLIHASSAVRNQRAFVFFGRSGAGKSTLVSMAPADATVLSEEISYVRRHGSDYVGCGTPFTGELNRRGDNVEASLAGAFLLVQGDANRIEAIEPPDALRALLQCVLCFSGDQGVSRDAFAAACDLVERVPVRRLVFRREAAVWDLIG